MNTVLSLKKTIMSDPDLSLLVGVTFSQKRRKLFIGRLMQLLPKGVVKSAVETSVSALGDGVANEDELHRFVWMLAGNVNRLKRGQPVYPWQRYKADEWMPVQIVATYPKRDLRDVLGAEFVFRVLAGSACPMLVTKFWSIKFCRFLAPQLGFTRRGAAQFAEPSQLVGLRAYAHFTKNKSGTGLYFDQVLAGFSDHNRTLMKNRARVEFECPENFIHPCHRCHVGYDKCPVGTHPKTFVNSYCSSCETDSWFDPSKPKITVCINCFIKGNTRHHVGT